MWIDGVVTAKAELGFATGQPDNFINSNTQSTALYSIFVVSLSTRLMISSALV